MKKSHLLGAVLACLFVCSSTTVNAATVFDLAFDSLPSSQGWTYQASGGGLETDVYSVDGTRLLVDTTGISGTSAFGAFNLAFDPTQPFSLSLRARVLSGTGDLFFFSVFTDTEKVNMFVEPTQIQFFQAAYFSTDNSQFHDFRYDVNPGVGTSVFIDNVLQGIVPTWPTDIPITPPSIAWGGNGGSVGSGVIEITEFTLTSVPIPPAVWLFVSGLLGLIGISRRKKAA